MAKPIKPKKPLTSRKPIKPIGSKKANSPLSPIKPNVNILSTAKSKKPHRLPKLIQR